MTGRSVAVAAVIGGMFYLVGGATSYSHFPIAAIERSPIGADGSLAGFVTESEQLMTARGYATGNVVGNYLYIVGGLAPASDMGGATGPVEPEVALIQ
jgi:hypothetical protein